MKLLLFIVLIIIVASCNNNSSTKSTTSTLTNTKQFVTANIGGKPWQSDPNEVLASYSEFDDKLQIFTKDAVGKSNVLLTLMPFSKTGVGKYSSVKENSSGFGISLLDDNTTDTEELDYDNFRQGAIENSITIAAINETAEGKMITGTFASALYKSNNYDAATSKPIAIDGAFAVLLKK